MGGVSEATKRSSANLDDIGFESPEFFDPSELAKKVSIGMLHMAGKIVKGTGNAAYGVTKWYFRSVYHLGMLPVKGTKSIIHKIHDISASSPHDPEVIYPYKF